MKARVPHRELVPILATDVDLKDMYMYDLKIDQPYYSGESVGESLGATLGATAGLIPGE